MTDSPPSRRPLAVVAFGGNALLQPGDLGTVDEQRQRAEEAARWLADFVVEGRDLVIVHGNGPQVGQVLIQMEEAATKVPPGTVDVAVAQTEGSMGYLLEAALRNRFTELGETRTVTTVLSLVVVDGDDPGFEDPTKPIGPFFSRWRAETLQSELGWQMIEDAGRGWRKVVASPRPLEVLGLEAARGAFDRAERSGVVIAGGGGGIPVVRRPDGRLDGVEAVIDKDFTSALVARQLGADLFIVLTNVDQVRKDYGTDREEPLPVVSLTQARELLEEGQFPPGSMGPKVRAAVQFVEETGQRVLITDVEHLSDALEGRGGTVLVPDEVAVSG